MHALTERERERERGRESEREREGNRRESVDLLCRILIEVIVTTTIIGDIYVCLKIHIHTSLAVLAAGKISQGRGGTLLVEMEAEGGGRRERVLVGSGEGSRATGI